jgi:uncharacterized protein YqcC (DUF446 family)
VAIDATGYVYCDGGCPAPQVCDLQSKDNGDGTVDYICRCITPAVEIDPFPFSVGKVYLRTPTGLVKEILMSGPATAAVYFEGELEGDADDDDNDGHDEVDTEMVELKLEGDNPVLGHVVVELNPFIPSVGEIIEQKNNVPGTLDLPPFTETGMATSYFDMFFRVTISELQLELFTQDPKRMSTKIDHKPPGPGAVYENARDIQLYDANGRPTEYWLSAAHHRPNPPVERDPFPFSIGQLQLQLPGGAVETIIMSGPAEAEVYFEGPVDGAALDNDGDGYDEVVTQMVVLHLEGDSLALGHVEVGLHPEIPSTGEIIEQKNNVPGTLELPPFTEEGMASSYFNMYFEVKIHGLELLLHTRDPKRMSTKIDHKPPGPGALYENLRDVELYYPNGVPSGYVLVATRHRPNPPVEIDPFDYSLGEFQLRHPDGLVETIGLSGPAKAHVYFEGPVDGAALDNDGDGYDEVRTQMVELKLEGDSDEIGHIVVGLNPLIPSMGEIIEQKNNVDETLDLPPFTEVGMATSYFNMYFQVVIGEYPEVLVLRTQDPKHMSSKITHKPPGPDAAYENRDEIQLFYLNGEPSGYWISAARHRPNPRVVERDPFPFSIGQLQLRLPTGFVDTIIMSGPAEAEVYFEGPEGVAYDDNGDGLDEVETEIVALNLEGDSDVLGHVVVGLHPDIPSRGEIIEQKNNMDGILELPPFTEVGMATSYFNMYFQVTINDGPIPRRLFTIDPKHMSTKIDHKPPGPGAVYVNLEDIQLWDAFGPTGYWLVATRHRPHPPVEVDRFDYSTGELQLRHPGPDGIVETIEVSGAAEAHVYFEGGVHGSALDNDGDGMDEVATQMVEFKLQGESDLLGHVEVGLHPFIPSMGEIIEQKNNVPGTLDLLPFTDGGRATSYFDMYFEVRIGDGPLVLVLRTHDPKNMSSKITHKPPGPDAVYVNAVDIELFFLNGQPSGYWLSAARHRPQPCPKLAVPVWSKPEHLHSLWRNRNNVMRFGFDNDITVPVPGQIEIVECQRGCG